MLSGAPDDQTDEAAAAFGINIPAECRPEAPSDDGAIWEENYWAVALFEAMLTQWRTGPNGVVGLDYNVRAVQAEQIGLPEAERRQAYDGLRDMEYEALAFFAEQRK